MASFPFLSWRVDSRHRCPFPESTNQRELKRSIGQVFFVLYIFKGYSWLTEKPASTVTEAFFRRTNFLLSCSDKRCILYSQVILEMEFLDITQFDKRLESFASCYSQSLLLADLKKSYKTLSRNKETRVLSWIEFCIKEKWGQKTRQTLESEKTQVYAQKPRLQSLFKNSISGLRCAIATDYNPLHGQATCVNSQLLGLYSHWPMGDCSCDCLRLSVVVHNNCLSLDTTTPLGADLPAYIVGHMLIAYQEYVKERKKRILIIFLSQDNLKRRWGKCLAH